MAPGWTTHDERHYEHIRDLELDRGIPEDQAEEIAAQTVNEQRQLEGRTLSEPTSGTANPRRRLESRSIEELRNRANELAIAGAATMSKPQLVRAIRRRNG